MSEQPTEKSLKGLFAKPTALVLIISSVAIRLIPHPANMTPVGATALFGGSKLNRPWNYLIPIFILFLTDLFLGFHPLMPYVYGCFLFSVWLAELTLKQSATTSKLALLATANSLIFFFVTNFGVWLQGSLYPHTTAGLMDSYIMGLPFLRNMLAGDLLFTIGVFSLYNYAEKQGAWQQFDKRLASWLLETGK